MLKKTLKRLFWFLVLAAFLFVAIRFGPYLYARLFSAGNTQWISERFSEELKAKNDLVVFETTITGKETASQSAWLVGTVQEVQIPYSYSISFSVDLSQSTVRMAGNTIEVLLPRPRAVYSKLTVDEANMKKMDWLYPLTPERYAAIKAEIEEKLYDECSSNKAYLDDAWSSAVKNMESLFKSVAEESEQGLTCDIQVIMEEDPAAQQPSPTDTLSEDESVGKQNDQ